VGRAPPRRRGWTVTLPDKPDGQEPPRRPRPSCSGKTSPNCRSTNSQSRCAGGGDAGRMRGMIETLTIGDRVAFYRRRRGQSQEVLAGLVGRTEDWLSRVENKKIELDRLSVISRFAEALDWTSDSGTPTVPRAALGADGLPAGVSREMVGSPPAQISSGMNVGSPCQPTGLPAPTGACTKRAADLHSILERVPLRLARLDRRPQPRPRAVPPAVHAARPPGRAAATRSRPARGPRSPCGRSIVERDEPPRAGATTVNAVSRPRPDTQVCRSPGHTGAIHRRDCRCLWI